LASNSRFICRLAIVDGSLRYVMVILPNDSGIAPGVCGVGGAHQQPLQFNKCREIHARRALRHRGRYRDGVRTVEVWCKRIQAVEFGREGTEWIADMRIDIPNWDFEHPPIDAAGEVLEAAA
jgi:hypothetical protein